jgi:hypothetical protein
LAAASIKCPLFVRCPPQTKHTLQSETIYGLKQNYFDQIGFHLKNVKCHFVFYFNGLLQQLQRRA